MQKLAFRPLTTEDYDWLQHCRNTADHPFTALCPVSLVTWAKAFELTVAGDDDFYVVRSRYDKGYYAPVGDPGKCAAFMEEAAREGSPVRFLYVTEPEARALSQKGWNVHFRLDLSEYIASSAMLSMEAGTCVSESFRTKCRKFARQYGGYRVIPVTAADTGRLLEIAERDREARGSTPPDFTVLETQMNCWERLGLQGIILSVPDGREAFILGYENAPDMFTMTMTRHDPTLPKEITMMCIHEFAVLLRGRYPLINVEEDMGLDGLRRSKILLSPVDLLKVYEVRL